MYQWAVKLLILGALLCAGSRSYAQDTSYLLIKNSEKDRDLFPGNFKSADVFYSTADRDIYLQDILMNAYNSGYLTAYYIIDTLLNIDTAYVEFYKGTRMEWAGLRINESNKQFLRNAGFKGKDFSGSVFRYTEAAELMQSMLHFAETHGYPFATVRLDSVLITDTTVNAAIRFEKNRLIEFDTIIIEGDLQLSENYLQQYTGIHPGEIYDESLVDELDSRLRELPFVNVVHASQVQFRGNKARIIVHLDKKNASRFDFLIGVLPNNEITGRLIVTGQGTLHLNNIFNAGELVDVYFSKLELATKELKSKFTYPYLPFVPLGLDGSFDLFLRDSTFLERRSSLGILYQLTGNNYTRAFTTFYNSDVLTIDTISLLASHTLPANLDIHSVSYGLAFNLEKLNYIYNPRKGFDLFISASAGTKIIEENNAIVSLTDPSFPEFDFGSLYDSLDKRSLNITYEYHASWFQPILPATSLVFKIAGASLINDQIFSNELFRIGGINSLRGFDDQSILASQYHIFTTELRYLLSLNSYAALFYQQAFYKDASREMPLEDYPYGFGAGITFETKAGIFAVNYALGSQNNNPVELRNAKIHFGYLNYF